MAHADQPQKKTAGAKAADWNPILINFLVSAAANVLAGLILYAFSK